MSTYADSQLQDLQRVGQWLTEMDGQVLAELVGEPVPFRPYDGLAPLEGDPPAVLRYYVQGLDPVQSRSRYEAFVPVRCGAPAAREFLAAFLFYSRRGVSVELVFQCLAALAAHLATYDSDAVVLSVGLIAEGGEDSENYLSHRLELIVETNQ